ncbi:hypothetical protein PV05_11788 [Exophiala xenobiotica]|uniref:Uncharacterized protein n=1 Tax=Exophiala xenobiotica TaxID=348802 RepID=A0A0D2EQY1_9EURO|nr:uncharacterized protein PV05_11788 [Exophiala xenobiotica]KIW50174.1 hypothetical protein PV05_11788 [Exophiala xenobiotica]
MMADAADETSSAPTTAYGTTVGDIDRTVSTTNAVLLLVDRWVGKPIASLAKSRSDAQVLKESLGEWATEAYDAQRRLMIPVLRKDAFIKHLLDTDGKITPSVPCTATAPWAHFLCALNIRPGMGITQWKPAGQALRLDNGSPRLHLEVDGEVLCHVINFYILDTYSAGELISRYDVGPVQAITCKLQFGTLRFLKTESTDSNPISEVKAEFEAGTFADLASRREPFAVPNETARFEGGTVYAHYQNALNHGVSNTQAKFPPNASLTTRLAALLANANIGRAATRSEPLLLTHDWLHEANRIRRRVLSQGGQDTSFLDDLVSAVDGHGFKYLDPASVKDSLRSQIALEGNFFLYAYYARHGPWASRDVEKPIDVALPVLNRYEREPQGTWKYTLFTVKSSVIKLLKMKANIACSEYVRVLNFDRDSKLWNVTVKLW